MGAKSGIEWTKSTWNPVTGCSKVSPGCAHCYAEELTMRYAGPWKVPGLPWTPANAAENVILKPARLLYPLKWRDGRPIFVNSMSDLFHENVPDDYRDQVFAVMALAPRHEFQVLTKRPELMRIYLRAKDRGVAIAAAALELDLPRRLRLEMVDRLNAEGALAEWPLPNVTLGVTIENRRFNYRADILRDTPAATRFISAEPLLGPLVCPDCHGNGSVARYDHSPGGAACPQGCADGAGSSQFGASLDLAGIDRLIVGGESGAKARPLDLEWLRALRDSTRCSNCSGSGSAPAPFRQLCKECGGNRHSGTSFFVKQLGGARPGTELEALPADLRLREFPPAIARLLG